MVAIEPVWRERNAIAGAQPRTPWIVDREHAPVVEPHGHLDMTRLRIAASAGVLGTGGGAVSCRAGAVKHRHVVEQEIDQKKAAATIPSIAPPVPPSSVAPTSRTVSMRPVRADGGSTDTGGRCCSVGTQPRTATTSAEQREKIMIDPGSNARARVEQTVTLDASHLLLLSTLLHIGERSGSDTILQHRCSA